MTTRQRRRVSLVFASLIAAATMALTLIHPAGARTHHAENIPPLLTYYGAIAYSPDGASGKARREKSRMMAERLAMERCAAANCRIVASFNKCGAVAHDGATYHGGHGPTRQAAEAHAVANLGGGWPVTWLCA